MLFITTVFVCVYVLQAETADGRSAAVQCQDVQGGLHSWKPAQLLKRQSSVDINIKHTILLGQRS